MLDAEITARLRAVFDEVCETVSRYESGTRMHVASKLLESAAKGEVSVDSLKSVGRKALGDTPARL
ncbi:hypothetical protein QA640_04460 [Bradyrhizobium sp. CB82]|uniref:hypothetical protein n=1 Tax=Bradyrhizobium sp. CB82 TaxID=3039159 RepID=UPI0024B1D2EC|nr:hypothetical protein [Bradyrhizobium sp. CB82]WFU41773.1 hypothetical protein QA640_04460 [Bradyrhizobium sp. CB82]